MKQTFTMLAAILLAWVAPSHAEGLKLATLLYDHVVIQREAGFCPAKPKLP